MERLWYQLTDEGRVGYLVTIRDTARALRPGRQDEAMDDVLAHIQGDAEEALSYLEQRGSEPARKAAETDWKRAVDEHEAMKQAAKNKAVPGGGLEPPTSRL